MSEQLALLPGYLTAHLQLTLLALLVGIGISVPAGVLVTRLHRLEQPILGVASVIQTVPSLALLAIMVPLLAALGFQSIGFLPAFFGLVLYSLLPILRNTVTGLSGIDPAVIEAARGVGMTPRQRLRLVELPLAFPVILAGIRISAVWTVGVATLSTPVGAPSLGNYIFSGLQTRNLTAVLVGCISAAALALCLDGLLRGLGTTLARRRRGWAAALVAMVLLLYGYAGVTLVQDLQDRTGDRIVVGAKTFTEQYILSEILAGQIRRVSDARVDVLASLGSTVAFEALRADEIDVYVDYTGTIWATIMRRDTPERDARAVLEEVGRFLDEAYGIGVVASLGFENAYAMAMRRADAERLGVARIGDLAGVAPRMTLGSDYEFFSRPEWESVRQTYGLEFARLRAMDSSLMYQAVATGDVEVITAFSTDGRLDAYDLVVLEDELDAIPPYDAVILVSPRLLARHPEVVNALRRLDGTIDAGRMRQMNLAVDQEGLSPAAVALAFLQQLAPGRP